LRVLLGSALWASWALPLYTPCVLRGALRFFFNEISTYLSKIFFFSGLGCNHNSHVNRKHMFPCQLIGLDAFCDIICGFFGI
jgi:hypothetical protein